MTDRGYDDGKLVIRRHYKADREDVWDAITTPERLVRWFLPISDDLRAGGRYQLEGNAGGEIVRCDRPSEIGLTWEIGEMNTELGLVALEKYLAGDLPEGRAVDWIAASAPEDLAAAHALAEQLAGEWVKVL